MSLREQASLAGRMLIGALVDGKALGRGTGAGEVVECLPSTQQEDGYSYLVKFEDGSEVKMARSQLLPQLQRFGAGSRRPSLLPADWAVAHSSTSGEPVGFTAPNGRVFSTMRHVRQAIEVCMRARVQLLGMVVTRAAAARAACAAWRRQCVSHVRGRAG